MLLFGLRVKIFSHLQRLGMDFYDREMGGRILTRIGSDVDTLSQLMQSGLVNAFVSFLNFFGVAVLLVLMSPRLALFVLGVVPPLLAGTLLFRAKSSKAYDRQRDRISAVNADLQENISGMRVARAFRRETRNITNFVGLDPSGYREAGLRSLSRSRPSTSASRRCSATSRSSSCSASAAKRSTRARLTPSAP